MYNPTNGTEYNLTLECPNTLVTVKIPLPLNTMINATLARKFQSIGIDILNQTDTFFSDRCLTFISDTNVQLTIRQRKSNFFPNVYLSPIWLGEVYI